MPVPALLGLPWLASVLGGMFTAIAVWLSQYLTKRLAFVAAGVALIIGLTATLFAALQALLVGIALSVPTEFAQGISMVLPSNFGTCIAIMVSARMLKFAYDWNVRVIQYKLF